MKILAISDWRIQPLEWIMDIVEENKPDVILYAGDDLERFIGIDESFFIKTENFFIELKYPEFKPRFEKHDKVLTKKFKEFIQKIYLQNNNFLRTLKVPFYYVNGNDDVLLKKGKNHYLQIHGRGFYIQGEKYVLAETPKRKITIEREHKILEKIEEKQISLLLSRQVRLEQIQNIETYKYNQPEDGIYVQIYPTYRKLKIRKDNEDISIFGSGCEFGLKSKINNNPTNFADIYLSHLPPLGKLDLSVRFGIDHIGSKELLDSVKKYKPRVIICGHSHIWSGSSEQVDDSIVINISNQDRDPSYCNYAIINTQDWSIKIKMYKQKSAHSIRGLNTIRRKLKVKRANFFLRREKSEENKTNKKYKYQELSEEDLNLIDEAIKIINPWKLPRLRNIVIVYEILKKVEEIDINTERVRSRIESLNWEKPKIIRRITFNPNKFTFLDVETGLANGSEPGGLWLIGIWHKSKIKQFLYPQEKKRFFNFLKRNKISSLVAWTNYDRNALHPILNEADIDIRFLDACQRTANCVVWHTYKLHELYYALFPKEKTHTELIPGHIAGLFADHLIIPKKSCKNCPSEEVIIERIKERNKIDLLQMIRICRKLWRIKRQNPSN